MLRAALASLFIVLLASLAVMPWLALDNSPAVEPPAEFQRGDLAWVKSLSQKHDPRRKTPHVLQTLQLDEADLNRLLNTAVKLKPISGLSAELTPGIARLTATLTVPANPFGKYLNVTADVAEATGGLRIDSMYLGRLPVPAFLADWGMHRAHAWMRRDPTYAALADAFARVHFDENQAALDYRWRPELLKQIERAGTDLLIAPEDRLLLLHYVERLDALLKPLPHGSTHPLVEILPRLFAAPASPGATAAAENRAALTALAAHVAGISLPRLLEGNARSIRRAPRVLFTLHGRRDFAEHYAISAALAANAGSGIADAIGLIKEEEDAVKGSGFSFTDLAANRAGVRLGERAVGQPAAHLRALLANARHDADLMPDFRDLPEFMSQAEFDRRFGPVDGPRYRAVTERIEARLDRHPLAQ